MNWDDEEDSVFEQALRADLPTLAQQNRMRKRILAAGVAAGTALGSTTVAAATQASFGASALSKLSALSWPAKLGLTAALAAPVAGVALPLLHTPARTVASLGQRQPSATTASMGAARKAANSATPSAPLEAALEAAHEAPPGVQIEPAVEPSVSISAPRAPQLAANNTLKPVIAAAVTTLGTAPSAAPSAEDGVALDSEAIPRRSENNPGRRPRKRITERRTAGRLAISSIESVRA